MEKIRNYVLKRIKPTREETEKLNEFIRNLLSIAKIVSQNAHPIIVGSTGRDTWLSGDHDIDLFLMYPKSMSREELEKRGLDSGKKITEMLKGKWELKYAEHPYVHAHIGQYEVDIVPCYKIKKGEKIKSAVDRSPLHAEYIIQKLDPALRDEVRLLKQFSKGIGIYGSDAKVQGVSGYTCELLVLAFGKFERVLKNVAKFKPGKIIDIESYWSPLEKFEKELKKKFQGQSLILIDPVDKNRNVTAALSPENFVKFVMKAKEFLDSPDVKFFFPEKRPMTKQQLNRLKSRKTKFIALSFKKPDVIDDVLYPQIRKAVERLSKLLEHHGFDTMRKYFFVDGKKVLIIFELETWLKPVFEKRIGPPIFALKNSKDFLKKYSDAPFGPYIDGDRWVIEKEREGKSATHLLLDFLRDEPKVLRERGIPSHLADPLSKCDLLEHEEFWDLVERDKNLSCFMREKYFERLII